MTIGQRIRYCRMACGMTQLQLAQATGIHPVSVRKYEAGMMQPLSEQIKRLADALQVSYFALAGLDIAKLNANCETDLMSLLLLLADSNILDVYDPAAFTMKSRFTDIFDVRVKGTDQTVSLGDIELIPRSPTVAQSIANWANQKTAYGKAVQEAGEQPDEATQAALRQMQDDLEALELELQATNTLAEQ